MSALKRLRHLWLDVHLWLGVGLLIPFLILGVTGSLLVWHDPLDRLLETQRYEISGPVRLAPSDYFEAGREAVGEGFLVTAVRMPEHAGDPVVVAARAARPPAEGQRPETRNAWLDPATARVLDVANPRADATGVMHQLHGSLMIPENGRKVVGWMGWAMLASSLTGIWLWWPRNGSVLKGLRWKRGPRTTFNLHHMMGFWLAIPLAALSFTGVYISFPQLARSATALFMEAPQGNPGGGGGRGGQAPLNETNLSMDAAVQAALNAAPGSALVAVNVPTRSREDAPSWRIQVRAGEAEPRNFSVDDATGVADVQRERQPPPGAALPRLMRRIHDGNDMGLVWQVIIFIGGWAPAVLGITGIVMWLRRRAARRAIRRGHEVAAPAAQAAE